MKGDKEKGKRGKRRKQNWTRKERASGSTEPRPVSFAGLTLCYMWPDRSCSKNTQTQRVISSVLSG